MNSNQGNETGRPVISAVNHYDVFPFNHGGSLGIRGLYKGLSEWFDVNIITFCTKDKYADRVKISDHVTVIPLVVPEELVKRQNKMFRKYDMTADTLVDSSPAVMRWYHEYPEIVEEIRRICSDSEIVLAEHVFTWRIIKAACPEKHLWYRSNNVEYDYKTKTYEVINQPKDLLDETYELEKECCEQCEKILTVSQLEADRFMDLYGFPESMREKFMDIRSGFDTDNMHTVLPSQREIAESGYEHCGVFIASDTPNALSAADICIDIARDIPSLKIFIVGRIWKFLKDRKDLPENVEVTGLVTDEEKDFYLSHCDFALNPMEGGAGINVKMFEYFAYGIPVITTDYGARGIEVTDGLDCVLTKKGNYTDDTIKFCALPMEEKDQIAKNALKLLEEKYSWRSLAERIVIEIDRMYGTEHLDHRLPLSEIALYQINAEESYLPKRPFCIRCAGNNGRKCLKFLRSKGLEPIAFVEGDESKAGTFVDDVRVITVDEFLKLPDNPEIVVAVWTWMKITSLLINQGVSGDRISVSWGDSGHDIFCLSDMKGPTPLYLDKQKLKLDVYDYAARLEAIKAENIISTIRCDIEKKGISVAQKYLASGYYKRFVSEIKKEKSIVIVGAGAYGKRLLEMLSEEGLESKIACICDNSKERRGLNALGREVISVEDAASGSPNSLYVITPRFYENEIMHQLGRMGVPAERIMIFTFDYTGLID